MSKRKLEKSDKTETESKYFQSSKEVQCHDSPYKQFHTDNKLKLALNDTASEESDFKTPVQVKRQTKPKLNSKVTKVNKQSKKRQCKITKFINEQYMCSDVNPEHLQLAIALSESEVEVNQSSENVSSQEKILKIRQTLEEYGFKSSKSNQVFIEDKRHTKKSKFRYITPIIYLRTEEDRRRIIEEKVSFIVTQSSSIRSTFNADGPSGVYEIQSEYLRSLVLNRKNYFQINNVEHDETKKLNYYIDDLKIERCSYKCGCLLRSWDRIPGREITPKKDEEITVKNKNVETQSSILLESKCKMSLFREQSPDLFASDEEEEIQQFESFRDDAEVMITNSQRRNVPVIDISDDDYNENDEIVKQDGESEQSEKNLGDENMGDVDSEPENAFTNIKRISSVEDDSNEFEIDKNQKFTQCITEGEEGVMNSQRLDVPFVEISDDSNDSDTKRKASVKNDANCSELSTDSFNNLQLNDVEYNKIDEKQKFTSTECDMIKKKEEVINFQRFDFPIEISDDSNDSKACVKNEADNFTDIKRQENNVNCSQLSFDSFENLQLNITDYINNMLKRTSRNFEDNIESVSSHKKEIVDDKETNLLKEVKDINFAEESDNVLGNITFTDDLINKPLTEDVNEKTTENLEFTPKRFRKSISFSHAVKKPTPKKLRRSLTFSSPDTNHLSQSKISDYLEMSDDEENVCIRDEELHYSSLWSTPMKQENKTITNADGMYDEFQEKPTPKVSFASKLKHGIEHPTTPLIKTALLKSKSFPNTVTPEKVIIKARNVTPMPEYDRMNTPTVLNELEKYGIKRLRKERGVQLLRHIYESTHPEISKVESDSEDVEDRLAKKRKLTSDNIALGPTDDVPIHDMIFERKQSKKIHSCSVPLHIAWHNLLSSNVSLQESVLLYKPLKLEDLHNMLNEQGFKYHIQDLLTFLDKKCITVRVNQGKSWRRQK